MGPSVEKVNTGGIWGERTGEQPLRSVGAWREPVSWLH